MRLGWELEIRRKLTRVKEAMEIAAMGILTLVMVTAIFLGMAMVMKAMPPPATETAIPAQAR